MEQVPEPGANEHGIWTRRDSGGIVYYELSGFPNLFIAFVTRSGGVSLDSWGTLNLSLDVGDQDCSVVENWNRLRSALNLSTVVTMRQNHSDGVLPITDKSTPSEILEGDACFTGLSGIGLGVRVADCLPVYIFSADGRGAGVAHCGWRGTASEIARKTAHLMSRRFSIPLSHLCFALGPSICPACYQVKADVVREFEAHFPGGGRFLTPTGAGHDGARFSLDLRAANRWLLIDTGLTEVASLDRCTFECETEFYSARRDGTTGRNLALIALRTSPTP